MNIYDYVVQYIGDTFKIKKWYNPYLSDNGLYHNNNIDYYVNCKNEYSFSIPIDKEYYYDEHTEDEEDKYNIVNLIRYNFVEVINYMIIDFSFEEISFNNGNIEVVVVINNAKVVGENE